jgi:cytochrome c oxidase subunit 2
VFAISAADHRFNCREPAHVQCNRQVLFDVTSEDLTYGFGLFRPTTRYLPDLVVPGHRTIWEFGKNGEYSIRSTEYSGPEGVDMTVHDAVRVVGCETQDASV